MERLFAYAFSAAVIVSVLIPVTWDPRRDDSFPLSPYPMFSKGKPTPAMTLRYAVALEADGSRHYVPPELVANAEVLQARAVIGRALAGGPRTARALCDRIASRIAGEGGHWRRVTRVQLVTGRHDAVELLTRDQLGSEKVHITCAVTR